MYARTYLQTCTTWKFIRLSSSRPPSRRVCPRPRPRPRLLYIVLTSTSSRFLTAGVRQPVHNTNRTVLTMPTTAVIHCEPGAAPLCQAAGSPHGQVVVGQLPVRVSSPPPIPLLHSASGHVSQTGARLPPLPPNPGVPGEPGSPRTVPARGIPRCWGEGMILPARQVAA